MRICIVGKYPPIEGGVSTRTHRYAHSLAARGHEVRVVTNAMEVEPAFRMLMREEDWNRCAADDPSGGSVRVHWTEPAPRAEQHIPWSNPFTTKLASLAATVAREQQCEVIFSFYLEPYAVAGHLASQMTGLPHVVATAGSDVGRLWLQPQLEPLYSHVFKAARLVITYHEIAGRLRAIGVDESRIRFDGPFSVPADLFSPDAAPLDIADTVAACRTDEQLSAATWGRFAGDGPLIGVYGKLGASKGSFALLAALRRLLDMGGRAGLLVMAHGFPQVESSFRQKAAELRLEDHLVQIPFLPYWRVPSFIRRCDTVCCLEQGFGITFHGPLMPREVLTAGGCLVASTELLDKQPSSERLVRGYNCVEVADVRDTSALATQLLSITNDPARCATVGRRARQYALEIQRDSSLPESIENILYEAAATNKRAFDQSHPQPASTSVVTVEWLGSRARAGTGLRRVDASRLQSMLRKLNQVAGSGTPQAEPAREAIRLALQVARAHLEAQRHDLTETQRALAALRLRVTGPHWAVEDDDIKGCIPYRLANEQPVAYSYDVNCLLDALETQTLPVAVARTSSYALTRVTGGQACILVVDHVGAQILQLVDGRRAVNELVDAVEASCGSDCQAWGVVLRIFELGIIDLRARDGVSLRKA
jgi:glycosyltransferase involved in cell wall biosynthesis